jgi:SAM-dependent methyltransferase
MDATAAPEAMFRFAKPTDEDLPALSRLAYDVSARECGACRNYHVKWPYLRSIGANGNGPEQCWSISRAVFREVLEESIAERTGTRWLIAGAADAGVPSLVRRCCLDFPDREFAVTLVDRCQTPLALSEAYAKTVGWSIRCVKMDLLAFSPNQTFDIILFHYTMGFFDEDRQAKLLCKAKQWLAPGGQIFAFVYYDRDDIDRPAAQQALLRWQKSVIKRAVSDGELLLPEDMETFLWRIENSRVPAMEVFKKRRRGLEGVKTVVRNGGFAIKKFVALPASKEEIAAIGLEQRPRSLMVLSKSE